jgi:putative transposase
VGTRAPILV